MTALNPIQTKAMQEECIVVDENDKVVGKASKYDCHRQDKQGNLILHRAFSVFLFNSKGELLLQKRSNDKATFADCWTNSCCSHPLYEIEEELEEDNALGVRLAAQRRLNQELGIPLNQINPDKMEYLTRIHYLGPGKNEWGEHEIDYILFLQKDLPVNPNKEEISEIAYVSKENLDKWMKEVKGPFTPWFEIIVKSKLRFWWDNLNSLHKCKDNSIHRFL